MKTRSFIKRKKKKEKKRKENKNNKNNNNKKNTLQGNVVFSHNPRESVFQKISNTRQNPLNPEYNADSFQETDHLYFPLMVNQAAVPKAETASPVLSGVLKPVSFSLK